jgi:hypothetical protein
MTEAEEGKVTGSSVAVLPSHTEPRNEFLTHLPPDIQQKILDLLCPSELFRLRPVCRSWQSLVEEEWSARITELHCTST